MPTRLVLPEVIAPDVGFRNPAMLFSRVVLPAPLRPTQATTWPSRTLRLTSKRTFDSPYETLRPPTVRMLSLLFMRRRRRSGRQGPQSANSFFALPDAADIPRTHRRR